MLTVGIQPTSEYAREKMWARIHILPLLQAEEDRDQVRRHLADQAREKELLGENLPVYNTNRYVSLVSPVRFCSYRFCLRATVTDDCWWLFCRFVRPTFAATPGNLTK